MIPIARWVPPFRYLRIIDRSHLPVTFRRVPRLSSPLIAKASTRCPSLFLISLCVYTISSSCIYRISVFCSLIYLHMFSWTLFSYSVSAPYLVSFDTVLILFKDLIYFLQIYSLHFLFTLFQQHLVFFFNKELFPSFLPLSLSHLLGGGERVRTDDP